ncbi:uncharacterized protein RJT20DRAFT_125893 [Scheffersomyces xylosifermentans]|uniref:uncharacterized protein n=1 Tax=Scheffersomyces xylosifermentans TaxID=1304137 RepID=UPI00315D7D4A
MFFIAFLLALTHCLNPYDDFAVVVFDEYGYSRGYLTIWDGYLVAGESGNAALFQVQNGSLTTDDSFVVYERDSSLYTIQSSPKEDQFWQFYQDSGEVQNHLSNGFDNYIVLCLIKEHLVLARSCDSNANRIEVRLEPTEPNKALAKANSEPRIYSNSSIERVSQNSYFTIRGVSSDQLYFDFSIWNSQIIDSQGNASIFYLDNGGNILADDNTYLIIDETYDPQLVGQPQGQWKLSGNNNLKYYYDAYDDDGTYDYTDIKDCSVCFSGDCYGVELYAKRVDKKDLQDSGQIFAQPRNATSSVRTNTQTSSTREVTTRPTTHTSRTRTHSSGSSSSEDSGAAWRSASGGTLAVLLLWFL